MLLLTGLFAYSFARGSQTFSVVLPLAIDCSWFPIDRLQSYTLCRVPGFHKDSTASVVGFHNFLESQTTARLMWAWLRSLLY